MKPLAILYTRISSVQQVDGYSLVSQEALCREFAVQCGYSVVEVIQDVISGEQLERPGLSRVFDLVSEAGVRHIIVLNVERLTRGGPAHYAMIAARLAQDDARVEFVMGNYDAGSPEAMLAMQIASTVAWYDNQLRRERTVRGSLQAAKNDKVQVGARPPYGYAAQDGALVFDVDEAAVVRRIFAWALEGVSANEITRRLCADRTPTRADKDAFLQKKNNVGIWNGSAVKKILHNRTYTGVWTYRKTRTVRIEGKVRLRDRPVKEHIPIPVPAIIDVAVFDAVQEQLAGRRATRRSNPTPDVLLQSRLLCTCGRVCEVAEMQGYFTYRCRSRSRRQWEGDCTRKTYERAAFVDAAVWQAVAAYLLDPHKLGAWVSAWRAMQEPVLAENRSLLRAAVDAKRDVERKLAILLDQMLEKGYAADVLEEERQALLWTHRQLGEEIAALQVRLERMEISKAQEVMLLGLAERLRQGLTAIDLAGQRQVLDLLQIRIHMVANQTARIEALLPFDVDRVTWERPGRAKARGGSGASGTVTEEHKGNENGIATTVSEHCDRPSTPLPAPAWHVPAP
jgi:site-specific DNA recombinase